MARRCWPDPPLVARLDSSSWSASIPGLRPFFNCPGRQRGVVVRVDSRARDADRLPPAGTSRLVFGDLICRSPFALFAAPLVTSAAAAPGRGAIIRGPPPSSSAIRPQETSFWRRRSVFVGIARHILERREQPPEPAAVGTEPACLSNRRCGRAGPHEQHSRKPVTPWHPASGRSHCRAACILCGQ